MKARDSFVVQIERNMSIGEKNRTMKNLFLMIPANRFWLI